MNTYELTAMIDHTLLTPAASEKQLCRLCQEAMAYRCATVAILPANVRFASGLLSGSGVGITTGISYPCGFDSLAMKLKETERALIDGATDIDLMMNVGALKSRDYTILEEEAQQTMRLVGDRVTKVILEVALLTDQELLTACRIYSQAGFTFVKSSTGFRSPPTIEQIALMKEGVQDSETQVKGAGGFSSLKRILDGMAAGATRFGTSSMMRIIDELTE